MALKLQKRNYRIKQVITTNIETKAPATFSGLYNQRNRWYKGSLLNLANEKYRGMLLNPGYGDLGMFQLPMIFVSAALSITLFVIMIWVMLLRPILQRIYNLSFIQFDFIPLFRKTISEAKIIDINLAPFFYGIVITIIATTFMLFAFKNTKKSVKKNLKPLLIYFFIYPTLIGIIWIGVMLDFLRGKIQKW